MRRKEVSNLTLNARDPIPPPPGCQMQDDKRPPPKIITYHKGTNGYSPKKVRQMIEEQKRYERECEIVEAARELASFEAKQNPSKKTKFEMPKYPKKPKIDDAVVNAYRPPEETKFYDYQIPRNPLIKRQNLEKEEAPMARGCACCNPTKLGSIRPRTACSTRSRDISNLSETCYKDEEEAPYQIGNSYWNVLDETSIPERPKTAKFEVTKNRPNFSMLRTGPRPAGIPAVLEDFTASLAKGEAKFKQEMAKKDDIAMQKREALLRSRAENSRNAYEEKARQTRAISALSGQTWAVSGGLKSARKSKLKTRSIGEESTKPKLTKEELEEIRRVTEYDNKLYEKYKSSKKPDNELERLIYQTGFNMQAN